MRASKPMWVAGAIAVGAVAAVTGAAGQGGSSLTGVAANARSDGYAPAHQWQLHSSVWVGPRVQLDAGLYYVGRLQELGVPSYARADARVELRLSKRLALVGVGIFAVVGWTGRERRVTEW